MSSPPNATPAPVATLAVPVDTPTVMHDSITIDGLSHLAGTKDLRAIHHTRQLAHKGADRRKAKRCVRCRYCQPFKWEGNGGTTRSGRPRASGIQPGKYMYTGADVDLVIGGAEDDSDVHCEGCEAETVNSAIAPFTISLLDIAKPAKLRGIAKEFEVVSPLPRVVALDDDFSPQTSADENDDDDLLRDWEYLELGGGKKKKVATAPRLSYAQAASRGL